MFEGLTKDEARQFRNAIIPALQRVRADIVAKRQQTDTSKAETSRGNNAMQSENTKR